MTGAAGKRDVPWEKRPSWSLPWVPNAKERAVACHSRSWAAALSSFSFALPGRGWQCLSGALSRFRSLVEERLRGL